MTGNRAAELLFAVLPPAFKCAERSTTIRAGVMPGLASDMLQGAKKFMGSLPLEQQKNHDE